MNITVKIGNVEVVATDVDPSNVHQVEAIIRSACEGSGPQEVIEQTATNVLLMEDRGEWRQQGQVGGGFCTWSAPINHVDVENYLKRGAMVCGMWGRVHPAYPERHPSRVRAEAESPEPVSGEDLKPQTGPQGDAQNPI